MPEYTDRTAPAEVHRNRRGHAFLPSLPDRAGIPRELEQDDLPLAETLVHLHYFSPSSDWWITELWEDADLSGHWWAFGFARLIVDPDGGEWGRIDLTRLEALRVSGPAGPARIVERDLAWRPATIRECLPDLL